VQLDDLLTGKDLLPEKEISSIVDNKPVKSCNPAYVTPRITVSLITFITVLIKNQSID
jgi:hypothetical protein